MEICRDTNAAINILKKGIGMLGREWQNSTSGKKGAASQGGKHGEKTASTMDGKPDIASGLLLTMNKNPPHLCMESMSMNS